MQQLEICNADNPATNTESIITLHLRFRHDKTASEAEAMNLSQEALIDYCQAYGLDIYEHDDRGVRTATIDQAKIIKEFRPLDVTRFRPLRSIARFYYARPFGFSRNGLAAEEINATK